ncbi:MAG: PIG-L family deacetylase [Chloroflexi bacterium]|nr:PIG-L family deacetylase [Chloroflexota bacterium]
MSHVAVIAAHPDDETMFAGGTLAKFSAEGHELSMVLVTRGEGGEVGEPPVGPKERLGELREAEMRCAAAVYGVRRLVFLGFVDPAIEIGERPKCIKAPLDVFVAAVARALDELRPDVVMTHGTNGEYGHPQHIYTRQAVWEALRMLRPWRPQELLTWCANAGTNAEDRLTNRDDPASWSLDVTPWFEGKLAAALCHRSQHAMFMRNSKTPDVASMLRRLEAFRRWDLGIVDLA